MNTDNLETAFTQIKEMLEERAGFRLLTKFGCQHPYFYGLTEHLANQLTDIEKAIIEKHVNEKTQRLLMH